MAARRKHVPVETPTHLVRADAWSGLKAGDPVDVVDPRVRRARWRFVAHVTNAVTAATWVEVVGGAQGEQRVRSFRPEQVFPFGAVRGGVATTPSIVDAPRLPF